MMFRDTRCWHARRLTPAWSAHLLTKRRVLAAGTCNTVTFPRYRRLTLSEIGLEGWRRKHARKVLHPKKVPENALGQHIRPQRKLTPVGGQRMEFGVQELAAFDAGRYPAESFAVSTRAASGDKVGPRAATFE